MLKRLPLFSYIFCLLLLFVNNFKDPVKPLPLIPTGPLLIHTMYCKLWYDDTIILVPMIINTNQI